MATLPHRNDQPEEETEEPAVFRPSQKAEIGDVSQFDGAGKVATIVSGE